MDATGRARLRWRNSKTGNHTQSSDPGRGEFAEFSVKKRTDTKRTPPPGTSRTVSGGGRFAASRIF